MPTQLWIIIGTYLKFTDFSQLGLSCIFFSRLRCKWVIYDSLRMSDNLPSHKELILLYQDKVTSEDPSIRISIDTLEFNNYRSTPHLDSILFKLHPKTLVLDFDQEGKDRVYGNFISTWIAKGYQPVEELKIVSMDSSQQYELSCLNRLTSLRKVSITGTSQCRIGSITRQLPKAQITHLKIHMKPLWVDMRQFACPICGIAGVRDCKNLIELDLIVHIYGAKLLLWSTGIFPNLEALRLHVLGSEECSWGNSHPWPVNYVGNRIFPKLKELVLENSLLAMQFPTALSVPSVIRLVGDDLLYLSILTVGTEEQITNMVIHLQLPSRFPKLKNLDLSRGDMEKLSKVYNNVDVQIVDCNSSCSGPRRWNYRVAQL